MRTLALFAAGTLLATVGSTSIPGPAEAQSRGVPNGSYAQSCSNARVNQGRLYAQCLDIRRRARATSIALSACSSGDIGNDNGLLVCTGGRGQFENDNGGGGNNGGWNGGGNNGGGWGGNNGGGQNGGWNGGGGRNSVTVFTARDYRGDFQTFRGEVYNLDNTHLNDQISSIQVNGPWEVCSDSGFRGECQIIDGNIRNLSSTGLNDRISSMRPVRGGGRW
ncbi:hypothetical protein BZG35_13090 [Brevundimonas sp. LM2]|uniref:beta/gamma crystallin-related protein n=1 Tax=Brevundimonas sp. LM2 TaxID=1938605 RepID=UPI000983EF41|nr:beta/gamma crystallin-related protein [Brevundimonas sp. LM2]AQR62475.1 hypothetical protein BZG35_13090 [Brevundimonas sp. LM2]